MVRRHLARNGSNPTSNQMTTDNAVRKSVLHPHIFYNLVD